MAGTDQQSTRLEPYAAAPGAPPARPEGARLRASDAGKVLDASEGLLALLGYASTAALREAAPLVHDLFGDHDERSRIRSPLLETLPVDEARWLRRDGTSLWVRLRARPAPSAPDAPEGADRDVEVIVEDVTGRQHLEAQLRQAQRREALGQLAGGMANDLSSVLTATLAHTDLLEVGLEEGDSERVKRHLGEIRRTATTGSQMIKHLLSFSRGERLKLQPVSLAEVVRDAMRLVRPLLSDDITVRTSASEVAPVLADAGAVERTLLALASRACNAMPHGGHLEFRVGPGGLDQAHLARTGWGDPGDYGVVTVTDDGRGMTAQTVSRLFQPFFSVPGSGEVTGPDGAPAERGPSGLSMSMVYGLMKQHRGFIQVESEPEAGTTVRLYFRLVEAPTRRETDEGARLRDASGPTVLYVEDDASLRRVACHILRSHGYRVLEANDGVDAMGVMEREGRPDLLITDLVMPSMSGLELVEQVEKEGSPPPILLTSGFRPEFLLGWKGDPEAYPFLEKPWQIETLLGTVRSLLTQEAAAGG